MVLTILREAGLVQSTIRTHPVQIPDRLAAIRVIIGA
jgi:hypothetical protein